MVLLAVLNRARLEPTAWSFLQLMVSSCSVLSNEYTAARRTVLLGSFAVVLKLTAKMAELVNLQGPFFWFDFNSVYFQVLKVRSTVLLVPKAIQVQTIVHCASPSLVFQFSVSVIHCLLFLWSSVQSSIRYSNIGPPPPPLVTMTQQCAMRSSVLQRR